MGQKVHPYGFRLGITQGYKSNWFAKPSKKGEFSRLIAEDSAIRTMLFQQLRQFGLTDVHIDRHADFLQVQLYVSKPRVFAQQFQSSTHSEEGKAQASIAQKLLHTIESVHRRSLIPQLTFHHSVETSHAEDESEVTPSTSFPPHTKKEGQRDHSKLSVIIKRSHSYSARTIAEQIREDLQKRMPFRRALKQALSIIKNNNGELRGEIKGAKFQIAGRLNGSEIARTEWTREGQVPLHTLRAKIDFCYVPAFTNYGVLGIKVWVYTDE